MTMFQPKYLVDSSVLHIPEMDEEHDALFAMLDQLKQHCLGGNPVPQQEADALQHALIAHFRTEERLAAAAGLNFTKHAALHATMLSTVSRSLKLIYQGQSDVFSMIQYIHLWFERHILQTDSQFAADLKKPH